MVYCALFFLLKASSPINITTSFLYLVKIKPLVDIGKIGIFPLPKRRPQLLLPTVTLKDLLNLLLPKPTPSEVTPLQTELARSLYFKSIASLESEQATSLEFSKRDGISQIKIAFSHPSAAQIIAHLCDNTKIAYTISLNYITMDLAQLHSFLVVRCIGVDPDKIDKAINNVEKPQSPAPDCIIS